MVLNWRAEILLGLSEFLRVNFNSNETHYPVFFFFFAHLLQVQPHHPSAPHATLPHWKISKMPKLLCRIWNYMYNVQCCVWLERLTSLAGLARKHCNNITIWAWLIPWSNTNTKYWTKTHHQSDVRIDTGHLLALNLVPRVIRLFGQWRLVTKENFFFGIITW